MKLCQIRISSFQKPEQEEKQRSWNTWLVLKLVNRQLIQRGVIDANCKFGEPGMGSEASERHDAVTLYFLETPTPEAMKALSDIARRYYRGDDLIGKKIAEGFFMSEVGSVSDTHAKNLIQQLRAKDQELSLAVESFLKSIDHTTGKERITLSEAQFYAVKETLNVFGVDMKYDPDNGFEIVDTDSAEKTSESE